MNHNKNIIIVSKHLTKFAVFFVNNKDHISELNKSGVYYLKCFFCYIGHTDRKFSVSIKEHDTKNPL